jgi:hypothetical protein
MIRETPGLVRETLHERVYTPIWKYTWSRQDELRCAELIDERIAASRAATRERSAAPVKVFGDHFDTAMKDLNWSQYPLRNPYDYFRYRVSPRTERFYSSMERPWAAQTRRELAIAALAVKRCQLRHNRLPPTLEALMPEFLSEVPHDFMNGQPLKYKLTTTSFELHATSDLYWPEEAAGPVE